MPEISRFYGIVIAMYHQEHNPPHFHAKYSGMTGVFRIDDLTMMEGELPKRVVALVLEWAFAHRNELRRDWDLAASRKPLARIEPLV